jgi:pyruvate,water dikinase
MTEALITTQRDTLLSTGRTDTADVLLAQDSESREDSQFLIRDLADIREEDVATAGGKAVNLGVLMRAGLPVPPGISVSTGAYDYYCERDELPPGLVQAILKIKRALGGYVAIRSSATCEDGAELSMAGVFSSYYVSEDAEVERALRSIYAQARSPEVSKYLSLHGIDPEDVKMGIVVQELIRPEFSGVMYVPDGASTALIQYVRGFGEILVDGQTHGSSVIIDMDRKRIIESAGYEAHPFPDGFVETAVAHIARIRRAFPDGSHDIEFAYREGRMFIVQTRPLTTELGNVRLEETPDATLEATKRKARGIAAQEREELGTSTAVLTDSNFSELLPRPTEMDFGIFTHIFTGRDGVPGAIQLGRREMGYPLGDESVGMLHRIGGRVYASVSRDAATFYAGFPSYEEYFDTLVEEYLQAITRDLSKGSYPEIGLYLQDPTLEDLVARYGEKKGAAYYERYKAFLRRIHAEAESFHVAFRQKDEPALKAYVSSMERVDITQLSNRFLASRFDSILEHMRTTSCVMFVKAARLGFYYSQRLLADLTRFGMSEQEAQETFGTLTQGLDGSMITDVNIHIAQALSVEEALSFAKDTVGHFSTGEMLEIRHPRLKDDVRALKNYVDGIRAGDYAKSFARQKEQRIVLEGQLLSRIPEEERASFAETVSFAQTYMALRETVKYYFTQEYSLLKDILEVLEDRLSLGEGDIYFVDTSELGGLVDDPEGMKHLIRARRQEFDNYALLDMPAVIREGDIDSLAISAENGAEFTELKGTFLASGPKVQGTVVNVNDFAKLEDAEKAMIACRQGGSAVILVATQLTLAHDPLINRADGLVVENAGIVSHAAQRAREMGKGAIGGIPAKYLKTGMRIEFDPANRSVRKLP